MPPEPTAEQIEQQLQKLGKSPLMQGELRFPALQWLIDFKAEGKYDNMRPSAKEISHQFYQYVHKRYGKEVPENAETRGKALFGKLAGALEKYYMGPGKSDSVIIRLQVGIGGGYEPHFVLGPTQGSEPADNAVISDMRLLREIEACAPEGTTDIWVAAPDLSNVGDATSPLSDQVRKAVHDNANRGVNYTYICPKGQAGDSRIQKLKGCFKRTSGKLYLHQIPLERFYEITLIHSHFISFNPLAETPDAYMQLPLSQSEKGWVKLGREDAERVLAKMKHLRAEYPAERPDADESTAL